MGGQNLRGLQAPEQHGSAELESIPADNRAFLASLKSPSGETIGVNTEKMETKTRDDQIRYILELEALSVPSDPASPGVSP